MWYNFITLNLWEQFHNRANCYFLVIAMMQMIPSISITSGRPLLLLPVSFVLSVSAIRDLFEDLQRKAADRAENERTVMRVVDQNGAVEAVRWHSVRPGHVLRLMDGDLIPADSVLLDSSDPAKTCRVETSNLDGESDLKEKVPVTSEGLTLHAAASARLDFEPPSADLYNFQGALVHDSATEPRGVGIHSLLLRGSTVSQVRSADCLVCYCGHDTRVMRNQKSVHFKLSQLEEQMNKVIISIFIIQTLLCIIGGIYFAVWEASYLQGLWYLHPSETAPKFGPVARSIQKSATWLLQLNNMVPISLMVGLTTVKFVQGKLVEYDEACKGTMSKGAEVHTSQVLESLGQITHVFSDKTGTLTCNHMIYKACSVAGSTYGLDQAASGGERPSEHVNLGSGKVSFLSDASSTTPDRKAAMARFLLCHALCHTVTVKNDDRTGGSAHPQALLYEASSPDELALVSAARDLGLCYSGQRQKRAHLQVLDARLLPALEAECGPLGMAGGYRALEVEVLDVCEFDNDRKRMSVVVRYPTGRKVLLVKGADTSILPDVQDGIEKQQAMEHLGRFARLGLRTLCIAARTLDEREYTNWAQRYRGALAALSADRITRVRQLAGELESSAGLRLLGVTAIEDQLQEGVPQTLESLREAGITVWVLTGDKVETAISIGRSCRLLPDTTHNLTIVDTDVAGVQETLRAAQAFVGGDDSPEDGLAVTISGAALNVVLENPGMRDRFYRVARRCRTVLCCRVSPRQKADVVELVQELHGQSGGVQPVTLAIGDGANDVSMITMANVGVGLSGKEGAQAARSADFALGQFRFLQRLLFVHGRESYRRNSTLVCYNFYKNMVLVLPPFLYGPCMAFSGQPFYEQVLYQFYNVFFTFFPCMCYAILDRPVQNLAELQWNPWSYVPGREKQYFNWHVFGGWMFAAIVQGALLSFMAFHLFSDGSPSQEGATSDSLWLTGTAIFFWVVLGVNLTLVRRLSTVLPITAFAFLFSVGSFVVLVFLLGSGASPQLRGVFPKLFGHLSFRFMLCTGLTMVTFVLIGEPFLSMTAQDNTGAPRVAGQASFRKPPQSADGPNEVGVP